ncbi:Zinc finger protein 287 [Eumeta japonica]|uniref:Zinc finger protein 287 n=1 Tax=Eumeta variegata TaxID=151549 RepID=A0A4C1VW47_EUMVA|nr:Zinc finger protein 287 [Eumeta japonica]
MKTTKVWVVTADYGPLRLRWSHACVAGVGYLMEEEVVGEERELMEVEISEGYEKSPPDLCEVEVGTLETHPEHDDTNRDMRCSIKDGNLSNKSFDNRKYKTSAKRRLATSKSSLERGFAMGVSNEDILNQILRMDNEDSVHYMCIKCEKTYEANEQCVNHVKKHFRVKLSCPLCDVKLVNQSGRADHLARRHGKRELNTEQGTVLIDLPVKYKCDFCDKRFSSTNAARKHMRFHEEKLCRSCGVMFDSPREVICHMEGVHGRRVPTCGICGYKCLQESKVLSHQRKVHMKEKNVKCELCDSQFFSAKDMRKHMVRHNPEKKFECDFCHKRYPRLNTLNEHRKIHTGVKNKVCGVCGERFVQKASLNYHMAKRHPDAKF